MDEKLNFMVFRAVFLFEVHIRQSYSKKKQLKIIKKSIMAAQKCKKYMVAGSIVKVEPEALEYVPDHLETQEMCEKAIEEDPWCLCAVPDRFKAKRMCEKAVEDEPESLGYIPDHLKTEDICKEAVRRERYNLRYVSDHLKTHKMCEQVIHVTQKDFFLFPDRFKTREMCIRTVKMNQWQLNNPLIYLWYYKKCGVKTLMIALILLGSAMHIEKLWG